MATAEDKLNSRLVARCDQLTRDIIAWNARRAAKAMTDVEIAQLRVLVGMSMRNMLIMGRSFERWTVTQPVVVENTKPEMPPRQATIELCVPSAVDNTPQSWEDEPTVKMPGRRGMLRHE